MKSFAERKPVVVGLVGVALTGVVVLVALNYNNLPFVATRWAACPAYRWRAHTCW